MAILIKKNSYFDSITLMRLSNEIKKIPGVKKAHVAMATEHNKSLLSENKLWSEEVLTASPNDLLIAFASDLDHSEKAVLMMVDAFFARPSITSTTSLVSASTIKEALATDKQFDFCFISVPGEYAAREARIALEQGLNVMLFSDNVSLEEELSLKLLASQKNLLMMGPDCGTAIIEGVGFGFSNNVRKGQVGIVGASGTGIQEVSCLLDRMGIGVSQVFGTGGRDLKKEIGGLMMIQGIQLLASNPETELMVLISKPPHPEVATKIFEKLEGISMPIVICFLGLEKPVIALPSNAHFTTNLTDTACLVSHLLGNSFEVPIPDFQFDKKKGKIFGLFCGGTLAAEAAFIIGKEHTIIDFGDDEFTKGRPHPMIDPEVRNQAFLSYAQEKDIAVFLFDIVLGFGSHPDPAGNLRPIISKIQAFNQNCYFVASVCGTEEDPQTYSVQVNTLESLGVIVTPSNMRAAQIARSLVL
jgi:FdrA protein